MLTNLPYYLYLNYVCNQKCIFCASPYTKAGSNKEVSYDFLINALKFEDLYNKVIILSGGEPTCYSNLFNLLNYLNQFTDKIDIMTNGLKIGDDTYKNQLFSYKINSVSIPIYGLKKTHNQLTRTQSFDKVIKGIGDVIDKGIEINIKFLITKYNYEELLSLLKYLVKCYGELPYFTLNTLIFSKNTISSGSWIPIKDVKKEITQFFIFAINNKLKLSFSYVPICIFEESLIQDYILHLFAIFSSKYTQQPDSKVKIITPDSKLIEDFEDNSYLPELCKSCSLCEICLKLHGSTDTILEKELGIMPIPKKIFRNITGG